MSKIDIAAGAKTISVQAEHEQIQAPEQPLRSCATEFVAIGHFVTPLDISEESCAAAVRNCRMPFTAIPAPKCPACKTSVYPAEQVSACNMHIAAFIQGQLELQL